MECFNCKSFYDDNHHSPRLLPDCGHSLCTQCLKLNYHNQTIICFECKTHNHKKSLELFPKNLALLYLKPPSSSEKSMRTSVQPEARLQASRDLKEICLKHNKRLEGFCESDRQLLCIACILQEGYKDRDVCTIQDAAERERNLIGKACQLAKITENKCKMLQSSLLEGYKTLASTAKKSCEEITAFFDEIRSVIAGRETNLKREIAEKEKKEAEAIKAKENTLSNILNDISRFYQDYKQSLKEDDLSLLGSSTKRIEMIKKITAEPENFESSITFKELDKQKELNTIWNVLSPLDERLSHRTNNSDEMRIMKNLSESSNSTKKSAEKNQYSILSAHSIHKAPKYKANVKQAAGGSGLRGTWANRKPEKPSKFKSQSGMASPVVQVKKNNEKQHEKLFEKIAELDCDYRGDATTGAQVPYNSQDMKPNYSEKSNSLLISQDPLFPQKATPVSQPVSASVITINLNDECPPYHQTPSDQPITVAGQKNWDLQQAENINPNYVSNNRTNVSKSEIKKIDTSYSSSFYTNGELLDLMNLERDIDLSRRLDRRPMGDKQRNFYTSSRGNPHMEKSYLNLSRESFMDFNKENMRYQQNNVIMSSRDLPRKDTSILPKDILDTTHQSVDTIFQERRHSDLNDTTMNKCDWSAICQSMYSYIYLLDGSGQRSYSQVERLDLQKGQWELAGTLLGNRSKFTAVVLPKNGNILLMGGKEKGVRTAACEEYNPDHRQFRPSQIKLKCEKSGFGALVLGDEIFICGGNTGKAILRSFESYNLTTGTWKVLPPLKQTRDELGLVIGPDQKIYAIGGLGGPNMLTLNTVERYDPEKKEWEYVAPLNVPRRALSVISLPDGIYAIGGFDGLSSVNTVEKYDDTINEWIVVGSMNHARCRAAAVASNDFREIYIFGGENNEPLNSVERYSVIKDKWELMEPMRSKKSMHIAVIMSK